MHRRMRAVISPPEKHAEIYGGKICAGGGGGRGAGGQPSQVAAARPGQL